MPRSLFSLPWFSSRVFTGLQAAMHQDKDKALAAEGAFMSQLMLQLLDWRREDELFNVRLYGISSSTNDCYCSLKYELS